MLKQIGSYLGFPSFNRTFGNQIVDGAPSISAPWQSAITNGAYIGEILGLQLTGYLVGWYGNKKVMGVATVMMIAFVFSKIRCSHALPFANHV